MTTPINLTERLILIGVPKESKDFNITSKGMLYWYKSECKPDWEEAQKSFMPICELPEGNYKIVGTVEKHSIDFETNLVTGIDNYTDSDLEFFRMMSDAGVLFENPFGEEPNHLDYKWEKFKGEFTFKSERAKNEYCNLHEDWQSAQEKVIEKALIIEKI